MSNFYKEQFFDLLDGTKREVSNISPSDWYEEHMVMPRGSAMAGKFSFDHTPYWREVVDCFSPYHPAKEISVMKGAQLGGTVAVLNAFIAYMIKNDPSNSMLLTGHTDLSKDAMVRIDQVIDSCGLRPLIGNSTLRAKNSRSGDTDKSKEFLAGGWLKAGSVTNHNLLRQYDVKYMIVDDYDAAPNGKKDSGATRELVQKRTSAFRFKKKICWMSSPQVEGKSNIEEVFLLGDQRYWHIPCPHCGDFIRLQWEVDIEGTEDKGGIYWKNDLNGRVDRSSVGYVCQSCGGFFDDSSKYELNLAGHWKPTAEAKEENHYSYHLSSLYAPAFMDNWAYYAQQYINANPDEGKRHEKQHQTFLNVVLGKTYQQQGKTIQASQLQKNIRKYDIGTIPDEMSIKDGNGHIVLLTCACDLGGFVEDCRLDYEIVGWSETGSSYSISHGSIGTFIAGEGKKKYKADRIKWTYEFGREFTVWKEFDKVLDKFYVTEGGRRMKISLTGMDNSFFTSYANEYLDKSNYPIVGLKGDKEEDFMKFGVDRPTFKHAKLRPQDFMLDVNAIKDVLGEKVELKWDKGNDPNQPHGFMNFPTPENGLYLYDNYFSHYEAEHKVFEEVDGKEPSFMWKKKNSRVQNHLFDCRVYNHAIRSIMMHLTFRETKTKNYTWTDFVDKVLGR